MSTTTPDADLRCPQCAAHVRAGSDWCTLCYADLRPAPAPVPAPATAAADPAAAPDQAGEWSTTSAPGAPPHTSAAGDHAPGTSATPPAADGTPGAAPGRRGKHAKHAARPSAEETEALAARLLAELAVHESGSPLGRFSALTDTTGKKAGLMIGGTVAVVAVLLGLMAVLGRLF